MCRVLVESEDAVTTGRGGEGAGRLILKANPIGNRFAICKGVS
jgi:hypothetical protein